MRSLWNQAARMVRIARRLAVDGRLPGPVEQLVSEDASTRARAWWQDVAASVRTPLAMDETAGADEGIDGSRRVTSLTLVPTSRFDLRHVHARAVVDALVAARLSPFLVTADDRAIELGLRLEDRSRAAEALPGALGPRWVLRWRRGHRTGTVVLGGPLPAVAARAEWWKIYRPHSVGDREVAGRREAATLTFWQRGPQYYERVGERGLHRFGHDEASTQEAVDGVGYPGLASFPVARSLTTFREPIDAVFTWVDGDDPRWRQEFERWARRDRSTDDGDLEIHAGRYRSRDELRFSLRSLWLNAGWVRRVFVVTSGQRPPWLVEDDRLRVVHHDEILPAEWRPTFNSHAIESRLHHIEELSEHFLYLNDDVFLARPVDRDQFFTPNGLTRFFESEAFVPTGPQGGPGLAADSGARNGRALLESTFGRVPRVKLHHAPHPLRRSIMYEIEERYPDIVRRTGASRFRHPDDLSIASAFAHHYAYCTGRALPGELRVGYGYLEDPRFGLFLGRVRRGRDLDAFCLNETERPDRDAEQVAQMVDAFLTGYFPIASPWEQAS